MNKILLIKLLKVKKKKKLLKPKFIFMVKFLLRFSTLLTQVKIFKIRIIPLFVKNKIFNILLKKERKKLKILYT